MSCLLCSYTEGVFISHNLFGYGKMWFALLASFMCIMCRGCAVDVFVVVCVMSGYAHVMGRAELTLDGVP